MPQIKGKFDSFTSDATTGKWTYKRSLFTICLGYFKLIKHDSIRF